MVIWTFLTAGCAVIPERPGSKRPSSVDSGPEEAAPAPEEASASDGGPTTTADTSDDSSGTGSTDSADAETSPDYTGVEGALVTRDCMFGDYPYAVDILLSCGDERFGEPLRLHTFKRHAHDHQSIFADQRLTYRDDRLWFDGYARPRCIQVDSRGRLMLDTRSERCTPFTLEATGDRFQLQDATTGLCAGLGGAACGAHEWTGGRECGGIDHRYLPLVMDDCASALGFVFSLEAESCSGEYPREECF